MMMVEGSEPGEISRREEETGSAPKKRKEKKKVTYSEKQTKSYKIGRIKKGEFWCGRKASSTPSVPTLFVFLFFV